MKTFSAKQTPRPLRRHAEQGVVLIFALIALVILLIGAVAITRSLSSSQFAVGNIGFKRDLANQSERALEKVLALVAEGNSLGTPLAREQHLQAANYRATYLDTNNLGVPKALLDDDQFSAVASANNDITVADQGVKVRYLVERLSTSLGPCSPANCVLLNSSGTGDSASNWINSMNNSSANGDTNRGAVPPQPVYRVTVRVTGPRGTRSFFQSTFTTK